MPEGNERERWRGLGPTIATWTGGARRRHHGVVHERVAALDQPQDPAPESTSCAPCVAWPSGALCAVDEILAPGITTGDINRFVHEDTIARGGNPAPLNYHGFPKSVCTSINEVVCHGIPRRARRSRTATSSTSTSPPSTTASTATRPPRSTSAEPSRRGEARHRGGAPLACELGIAQVRPGARLGDIGAAIQEFAEAARLLASCATSAATASAAGSTTPPQVAHVGQRGKGARLQRRHGLHHRADDQPRHLTRSRSLDDDWTVVTRRRVAVGAVRAHDAGHGRGRRDRRARAPRLPEGERFPDYFGAWR